MSDEISHDADCDGCPLRQDRRDFIRTAVASVGGVMMFGTTASVGRALAVSTPPKTVTYAIPAKDGVQIDKDNDVILVRSLGSVYAFSLSCPHQNTALRWNEKDEHFHCPKHHSEYATDGYFISGRATRGMDRYAIKKDGKNVVVDLSDLKKDSDDADGWKNANVSV